MCWWGGGDAGGQMEMHKNIKKMYLRAYITLLQVRYHVVKSKLGVCVCVLGCGVCVWVWVGGGGQK